MKKLVLRRVLLAVAVPVAIRGTRALAERAAGRPGSSRYAPGLRQVADALQRRRAATRRSSRTPAVLRRHHPVNPDPPTPRRLGVTVRTNPPVAV